MTLAPAAAEKNTRNAVVRKIDVSQSFVPSTEYRVPKKNQQSSVRGTRYAVLAGLSGALLSLCYPMANFSWLAWLVLAPFFYTISKAKSRKQAVFLGWVFALSFFTVSLHFLIHVAFAAWPALALLESLYGLILGLLLFETRRFSSVFLRVLWIASVWTAVEFLRTEIPIWGFGLNLLGHSQGFQISVIQIASVGGAYLLSFVISSVNALIAEIFRTAYRVPCTVKDWIVSVTRYALLGLAIVSAVIFFGVMRLKIADQQPAPTLRLSVIQPNIPQSVK